MQHMNSIRPYKGCAKIVFWTCMKPMDFTSNHWGPLAQWILVRNLLFDILPYTWQLIFIKIIFYFLKNFLKFFKIFSKNNFLKKLFWKIKNVKNELHALNTHTCEKHAKHNLDNHVKTCERPLGSLNQWILLEIYYVAY